MADIRANRERKIRKKFINEFTEAKPKNHKKIKTADRNIYPVEITEVDKTRNMVEIHFNAPIIGHPLGGGGTPGKGGDFVQDPVEVLDFSLLEGDTEQAKLGNPYSQMGIILNSIKPQ